MSMSAFAHATAAAGSGGGALVVNLDASYSASDLDATFPYSSTAGFLIGNNGNLSRLQGTTYTDVNGWLASGAAGDVQVSITKTGGSETATGMTSGTWYTCSTSMEFTITNTTIGIKDWSGTLAFRVAATQASLDSATITLTCTNES